MKFINKEVLKKMDRKAIQASIASAYQCVLDENYHMPDRIHVGYHDNTLLLMPCFTDKFYATKLVSFFPKAADFDQPVINGILVLADTVSGHPVCLFDGAALTSQRTGAVGGMAVSLLTSQNVTTAGILGAGVQGLNQARYLLMNRDPEKLYIYDLYREPAERMISSLKPEFDHVDYIIADNAEQLVKASQVVIAATTSKYPLFELPPEQLKGKTFISIGSFKPDMQEFPESVCKTADYIFVDTPFAVEESGDIANPLNKGLISEKEIFQFNKLIKNPVTVEGKTIFFKAVGMALFDLITAVTVYEFALKHQLGQQLDF